MAQPNNMLTIHNHTGGLLNISFQYGPGNHHGFPMVQANASVQVPRVAGILTAFDGAYQVVSHYNGMTANARITNAVAPNVGLVVNYF